MSRVEIKGISSGSSGREGHAASGRRARRTLVGRLGRLRFEVNCTHRQPDTARSKNSLSLDLLCVLLAAFRFPDRRVGKPNQKFAVRTSEKNSITSSQWEGRKRTRPVWVLANARERRSHIRTRNVSHVTMAAMTVFSSVRLARDRRRRASAIAPRRRPPEAAPSITRTRARRKQQKHDVSRLVSRRLATRD